MKIKSALVAMVIITFLGRVSAQTQPVPGPVPPQILAARKVFISNAPGTYIPVGGVYRTYDVFYGDMRDWGKYELVSSPGEADLVFSVSFMAPLVGVAVTNGNGLSTTRPQLNLVIVDPKTQVTLWWLEEDLPGAFREKTVLKNFDEAIGNLVNQLKTLSNSATRPTKP